MKARFSQPQLPVKTVAAGDKTYIFICLNETQGTESYPDMGEGQTTEAYYEYDYNEIIGDADKMPLEDMQAYPENYLDYVYKDEASETVEQKLQTLTKSLAENSESITDVQLALAEIYELVLGGM
mgnify:FL=1